MAVATRMVFAPIEGTNEVWDLTAEAPKGTALVKGTKAGVTLGNSGGSTFTETVGLYSISGPNPAAGYAPLEAGVHTTGTFLFAGVTGVTTTSKTGDPVYLVVADNTLTTTAGSNVKFGALNYPKGFTKAAGLAPIKIGA